MEAFSELRRRLLALTSGAGLLGLAPLCSIAQEQLQSGMPVRQIPGTNETLPIIGLGSSKVVTGVAKNGIVPLDQVIRTLASNGGTVVDTWPRNPDNDAALGQIISQPDLVDRLFVTTKIDQVGRQAGIDQFEQTLDLYQRDVLDLTQIFSLTDLDTQWPSLREWKETGRTRYIGVTVSNEDLYPQLEEFLARENPDFIQVNYSIVERGAEERLLPLAADRGIAVLINRPFMNGAYFDKLSNAPLPAWAAEFECETWAQFSLKYILAHPALTCVLTETGNPVHMAENALTASSALPGDSDRLRMKNFIDNV
jgi:diketogulonate reductase-like aldo/keto reductase